MRQLRNKYANMPIHVRAGMWFFVCSFLQKAISSITTPIFTRLMTAAEYGQFSVFNSWLSIISIFVTLNISLGVYTQCLVKFNDDQDSLSSSMQGLTLVQVLCWTGIYLLFRGFWNKLFSLTTMQMLAMMLTIWTSAIFNFWTTEQRFRFQYIKLVVATLIIVVMESVASLLFVACSEDKVTARILGIAIFSLIGCLPLFISQVRRGRKLFHARYWKYVILFNLPLIPHYLSLMILNNADRIMIQNMVGEVEAGIYSLAYSVSLIMTLFSTALSQTIDPWMYGKIKERCTDDIAPVAYGLLVMMAMVNLFLILVAPEVIAIFAPPEYFDAIYVIPPVTMSVYFIFAYNLFVKFEFYYEKKSFIMLSSIVAAVVNIILNFIFIKACGYYAAGYTTLVCYFISTLGHYYFMKKITRKYMQQEKVYDFRILAGITLSFLAIGFAFLFLYKFRYARYSVLALCVMCVLFQRKRIISFIEKLVSYRNDHSKAQ